MINYLNNAHHKELLSCGSRHMAATDINCIGSTIGYENGYSELLNGKKIIDLIATHINSVRTKKFWRFGSRFTVGNISFVLTTNRDKETSLTIKDPNCFMGLQSNVFSDCRFVYWFVYNYCFAGLGEIEDQIYSLVREYLVTLSNLCILRFHHQCNPEVNRRLYNPEVCARNISFTYWACQTFINAIDQKSYDDLVPTPYRTSAYCVNAFEDLVNKVNGTNYQYSRLYYNDESDKKEYKYKYDVVRAALGLKEV